MVDVAARQPGFRLVGGQQPRLFEDARHLRHGDARYAQRAGEPLVVPAAGALHMRASDQQHDAQREILGLRGRQPQLHQAEPQVAGVLQVEGHLHADQQHQPAGPGPHQRGDDEREARVHDGEAAGMRVEVGEHLRDQPPQQAGHQPAADRRQPAHGGVGHEAVERDEEGRDHQRRRDAEPEGEHQQHRPHDHQHQVLGDAPAEGARLFDPPKIVEAVLDLLDGAHQGPQQQREAERADQAARHAVHEGHDARGELRRRLAHGAEELQHQRLEVALRAEHLEHREAEGEQRDEREQGVVDEPHGAQVDVAERDVADHRIGIAQQAQRARRQAFALRVAAPEPAVELPPGGLLHASSPVSRWPGR